MVGLVDLLLLLLDARMAQPMQHIIPTFFFCVAFFLSFNIGQCIFQKHFEPSFTLCIENNPKWMHCKFFDPPIVSVLNFFFRLFQLGLNDLWFSKLNLAIRWIWNRLIWWWTSKQTKQNMQRSMSLKETFLFICVARGKTCAIWIDWSGFKCRR